MVDALSAIIALACVALAISPIVLLGLAIEETDRAESRRGEP